MVRARNSAPLDESDVAWSCVVDDTPGIWRSIIPWLATAIDLARIAPSRIHVHHVCPLRPDVGELCRTLQVNTHQIDPFDPRHPHTNKIRQCATVYPGARHVVLTDVDLVFASPPPFEEIRTPVAGKLVDEPNPPIGILRKVFSASLLPSPRTCRPAYVNPQGARAEFDTLLGNYNGGLYVIAAEHLDRIGQSWTYWARWLITNIEVLGQWNRHVDQVSFCLAVSELRLSAGLLEDTWNFPLHRQVVSSGAAPVILHHHALLDEHLHLEQVPADRPRQAIERVNRSIDSFRRLHSMIWKDTP